MTLEVATAPSNRASRSPRGCQGTSLGTPAVIPQKINESLRKVLSEPDLAVQLATHGAYVDPMSPSEVDTFINARQDNGVPWLEAFEASMKK